jgi:hypothetical protein
MRGAALAAVLLMACGGGEDVPSCQEAVTHYYDSGCAFFDLETGDQISAGQAVSDCRFVLANAPPSCENDVEDLIVCLDSVPSDSTTNEDCDCASEQESLLTCD